MRREVACCVEGVPYLAHCATMLRSLLVCEPEATYRVHLLHGGLPRRRLERIAGMLAASGSELVCHEVPDAWVDGLEVKDFTGKATWYRLFLPEVVADADRVLYLDSDVLVMDAVGELWRVDLDEHYLAAVTNVIEPQFAHRPAELGIADPLDYFNAGVLMLNLEPLRRDRCTERMVDLGRRERSRLGWRDQDVLNMVLGERRHRLHPRWNSMNILATGLAEPVFGAEAVRQAIADPAIRHFEGPGPGKPWHAHAAAESRRAYLEHRRATPWPRFRPERDRRFGPRRGPRRVY
jgi:lipopolysaccharide biosynthesis glycosyltransferase